jgi:hypothetical protein
MERAEHDCPEYAEKPALPGKRTEPVLLGLGSGCFDGRLIFNVSAEELFSDFC